MSIKRVAESVPMDLWVPAAPYSVTALCEAILTIFRDEGGRSDRQKARLMYLVDDYGTDAFAANWRSKRSVEERLDAVELTNVDTKTKETLSR